MKVRVHYIVYGEEGSFDLEGDDVYLEGEVKREILGRGLNLWKNNCWTEIII